MATQALMQALGRSVAMEGSAGRPAAEVREGQVLSPMRFQLLDALLVRPDHSPVATRRRRQRSVLGLLARRPARAKPVPTRLVGIG